MARERTHDEQLERTSLAQEVRLLRDVLDALGGAGSIEDVVRMVGYGVKNIVPYSRWQTVSVGLLTADRRALDVYRIHGKPVNSYWSNVGKGVLSAGRDLGCEVSFVADGSDSSFQERAIDHALAQGVDGIAVAPIDPQALEPAIRRARAAGIPVVTIDTPPEAGSEALLYIGTDNVAAGRIAGEVMARLLPEGGQVGVMVHYLQALNGRQRIDGFQQGVAGSSIDVLPALDIQGSDELGAERARALLAAQPGLVGAFGGCGINGPGWAAAAAAEGLAGQLRIVAFDIGADTTELLKRGAVHAVIAQREADMGYQCVQILCRMATGGLNATLNQLPASRIVDTGVDVVTLNGSDWSISLADYLVGSDVHRHTDHALRRALQARGRPPRILVVGMAEQAEASAAVERQALGEESVLAQVVASERPQVVQALDGPIRIAVGAPLHARGALLGAMSLESATLQACTPGEQAQLARVAGAAALLIENANLLNQLAERGRELSSANQRQEALLQTVRELSSPVVPIARAVLVMPLIGSIDSQRASEFISTLLDAISRYDAQVVLVDITGVPVIDTAVAASLGHAARAAQLLGAELVLVGITPPVAQTMVGLGLDFGRTVTRADLQSGFAYALARTGGRIVYS
jgi:ABC-type sugar transport system substrate-binding protein/anti-anti-sigma regulatory factor